MYVFLTALSCSLLPIFFIICYILLLCAIVHSHILIYCMFYCNNTSDCRCMCILIITNVLRKFITLYVNVVANILFPPTRKTCTNTTETTNPPSKMKEWTYFHIFLYKENKSTPIIEKRLSFLRVNTTDTSTWWQQKSNQMTIVIFCIFC